MERNDNGILRSPLKNESYYGSHLFYNGSGGGSEPIPKGRKVQNVKIIDAIFFDPEIEPDPGYWAMKKVKAIHDRATQVFVNSDGHLIYRRTEDEELDLYLENEHLFVTSPGEEAAEE